MSSLLIEYIKEDTIHTVNAFKTVFALTILAHFLKTNGSVNTDDVVMVYKKLLTKPSGLKYKTQISDSLKHKTQISNAYKFVQLNNSLTSTTIYNAKKLNFDSLISYVGTHKELSEVINTFHINNTERGMKVVIDLTYECIKISMKIHGYTDYNKNIIVVGDKCVTYGSGIGKKELINDYGLQKQTTFLKSVFGLDQHRSQTLDNYKKLADNDGSPTSDTIFKATKELYNEYSIRLNTVINIDKSIVPTIVNGIKHYTVGNLDDVEVVIVSIDKGYRTVDYNLLRGILGSQKLHFEVKNTNAPMLALYDESNDEIFKIRTRKEQYKNIPSEHRYKIYLELSSSLLEQITRR